MQDDEHNNWTTASLEFSVDYINTLVEFMSFMDETRYASNAVFSFMELIRIRPIDIVRWMKYKVYGTTDPGVDDLPLYGRSSSLEHYKKSLSYYMPERLHPWSMHTNSGVPVLHFDMSGNMTRTAWYINLCMYDFYVGDVP
jgi:hypothetical protein